MCRIVSREIIKRLRKTSKIEPSDFFAPLLSSTFYAETFSKSGLIFGNDERDRRAMIRSITKAVFDGMARMRSVPHEHDLSEDAPNKFLDSLTGIIMDNPVLLSVSKQYVDLSTVDRLAGTDPFTGTPLGPNAHKVDAELKRKINDWCDKVREK